MFHLTLPLTLPFFAVFSKHKIGADEGVCLLFSDFNLQCDMLWTCKTAAIAHCLRALKQSNVYMLSVITG